MEFTKISDTGVKASRICLGTWAIGGWMWGGTEEEESIAAIHGTLCLLLSQDEKIWVLNFKGETVKSYKAPHSSRYRGEAKGVSLKLKDSSEYLAVIVDFSTWKRSILYLYDRADQLVYEEVMSDSCFSVLSSDSWQAGRFTHCGM